MDFGFPSRVTVSKQLVCAISPFRIGSVQLTINLVLISKVPAMAFLVLGGMEGHASRNSSMLLDWKAFLKPSTAASTVGTPWAGRSTTGRGLLSPSPNPAGGGA